MPHNNIIIILIFLFLFFTTKEIEPKERILIRDLDESIETTIPTNGTCWTDDCQKIREQLEKNRMISSKPTLLGFGNFKIDNTKLFKLSIFLKNVAKNAIKPFRKYVYFKVIFRNRIRYLEDSEEDPKIINGTIDEASLDKEIVIYNVNTELDNSFEYFDINPNFIFLNKSYEDLDDDSNNYIENELEYSGNNGIFYASYYNFKKINEQEEFNEKNYLEFHVIDINSLGSLSYKIKGSFNHEVEIKNKTLVFEYFEQGIEPRTFVSKLEEVENQKNNYTLSFRFNDFVNADLGESCCAKIPEKDIVFKRMLEEENYISLYLSADNPEDLIFKEEFVLGHNYGRKIASSSGLSGGAIAGIVISCVVALVGVALAFIYFNRPNIKPIDANAIEFYNNSNVNSSVAVIQD